MKLVFIVIYMCVSSFAFAEVDFKKCIYQYDDIMKLSRAVYYGQETYKNILPALDESNRIIDELVEKRIQNKDKCLYDMQESCDKAVNLQKDINKLLPENDLLTEKYSFGRRLYQNSQDALYKTKNEFYQYCADDIHKNDKDLKEVCLSDYGKDSYYCSGFGF